jgi:hypothetical protein
MTFFNYFYPSVPGSAARATPTVIQTIIQTSENSRNHHQLPLILTLSPSDRSTLLLLFIPILWLIAHLYSLTLTRRLVRQPTTQQWDQAWQTNSWPALYGLVRLSFDNNWTDIRTPFTWQKSILRIWHQPNRPWLGRLLAMGIIPLTIQDGGISTYRVPANRFLTWKSGAANWFGWPMYVQSKKRACFEFIVPRTYMTARRREKLSDREARESFLDAIKENRMDVDGANAAVEARGSGVIHLRRRRCRWRLVLSRR